MDKFAERKKFTSCKLVAAAAVAMRLPQSQCVCRSRNVFARQCGIRG